MSSLLQRYNERKGPTADRDMWIFIVLFIVAVLAMSFVSYKAGRQRTLHEQGIKCAPNCVIVE